MVIAQLLFSAIRNLRSARTRLRERTPIVVRPRVVCVSSVRWVGWSRVSYRRGTTLTYSRRG